MNYKAIIILVILMQLTISNVLAIKVVPATTNSFTCVDFSRDFAVHNTGWGLVSISDNQYFRGVSHMVNYQVVDNETLNIHDGLYNFNYTTNEWKTDGRFYHFWGKDKQGLRCYRFLWDNRNDLNKTGGN